MVATATLCCALAGALGSGVRVVLLGTLRGVFDATLAIGRLGIAGVRWLAFIIAWQIVSNNSLT